MQYADGVLFVSENPSQALHKVSEIYDRIAFAAVGRYNEFENLRIAGVRLADMRGYAYDRRDVTGRGLANAYAQTLGTIFSSGGEKPYEVEIFVAEIGDAPADDQLYRLTYDGQVADEHGYAVMGGAADVVAAYLEERYAEGAPSPTRCASPSPRSGHTGRRRGPGASRRTTSRSPSWTAPAASRASSAGSARPARAVPRRPASCCADHPARRHRTRRTCRVGQRPGRRTPRGPAWLTPGLGTRFAHQPQLGSAPTCGWCQTARSPRRTAGPVIHRAPRSRGFRSHARGAHASEAWHLTR